MNEVTLANFRCFHRQQSARLAPLTLVVGDNSTGKTSFLALIRALWDVAFLERAPDFKGAPYDLGSFDEIVHNESGNRASSFEASFRLDRPTGLLHPSERRRIATPVTFRISFGQSGSAPAPIRRRLQTLEHWIEYAVHRTDPPSFRFGNGTAEWAAPIDGFPVFVHDSEGVDLTPLHFLLSLFRHSDISTQPAPDSDDWSALQKLAYALRVSSGTVFASAPVRSQPRRSYDPARPARDSEGQYVPMYLAHLCRSDKAKWRKLKASIERFGRSAGLFEEIQVRELGRGHGDPFQIRVRRYGTSAGPKSFHNLVDLGYGVSQVLPIVTEVLRPTAAQMFLLQQPEVHLHPSAQAALGTFFCEIAAKGRQLIVETHSDHLIDRVRMDVRDRTTKLRADDVSLLFFERGDSDVRIHSLRFDDEGNVVGAPDGYRRFFMEETHRSVGLG